MGLRPFVGHKLLADSLEGRVVLGRPDPLRKMRRWVEARRLAVIPLRSRLSRVWVVQSLLARPRLPIARFLVLNHRASGRKLRQ